MQLPADPRYIPFVSRYAFDVTRFAVEVCGIMPTHQQVEMFRSVAPPGSRTAIRSGHGTGKSKGLAVVCLWHLLCYPKSNTLITAPRIEQTRNVAWKEISDTLDDIRDRGGHQWIYDYVDFKEERIYIKGYKPTWFVIAKTAPRGNPENMAGMHRDWYLIIADEASGIPDPNFAVITGALTDQRNRMLMLSQPTRPSGFFYDAHHKLALHNGATWRSLRFDSTDSPLVSNAFLLEKRQEYTEEEYAIKVLGEFPENRDGYLLGRATAEACIGRRVLDPGEPYGLLLAIDVGAGEYRDKSVALVARVTGSGEYGGDARRVQVVDIPILSNTRDLQSFTGEVFRLAAGLESVTVLVDAGGMGVAVCQGLETLGIEVTRVKWGTPCFRKENRERFVNLRAQALVAASRAAKEGRLGIAEGPWRRELLDQMARTPYRFDERARYQIERKDDMRKAGLPSPDIWDAAGFCFLEGVSYSLVEGALAGTSRGQSVEAAADALFAGVG